ncbi:SRPBCC family protein [Lentzea albidocapillata]|uniref:Polyketide cyclase / dehydrase and lipid transport n=1 Tax=Lentzea albidocapillata TaxID=40571 RepID=A0A1W2FRT8_9PSEU|nr:SRPBCC family protein [Lentzea albidocapillata]SMD24651.1 Polyketide cyclase / dehydrase and lipid transport [Lentzea albidocapillata]
MTRSRSIPADAEAVFDVVSDFDNMTTWLPDSIEIELSGPNLIRLWLPGLHADVDVERQVAIDWDRLHITWGSETTASCSGTLQVLRLTADRSTVCVRLTGPPAASPSTVEAWIEAALDALESVVATECRTKQAVHQPVR